MLNFLYFFSKLNHLKIFKGQQLLTKGCHQLDLQLWSAFGSAWGADAGAPDTELDNALWYQCHRWDSINSLTATIVGPKHPEMYMFFLTATCRFLSFIRVETMPQNLNHSYGGNQYTTYIFDAGSQALQEGTGQPERPQETIASRSLRSSARANWRLSMMFDSKKSRIPNFRFCSVRSEVGNACRFCSCAIAHHVRRCRQSSVWSAGPAWVYSGWRGWRSPSRGLFHFSWHPPSMQI